MAFLLALSYYIEKKDDEKKIKVANEYIDLHITQPLDIRLKELDSFKISLDAMDSLLVKFDELKRLNVRISNTVKTNSVVRSK